MDKFHTILDAAYAHFGAKGFYDTKISEIAETAGIAKGTVYLYFKSKEQLFAAVSKRDFDTFLEHLEEGLAAKQSLEDQLRFIAKHHLEYYYDRKDHTKLFFMAPNNDPELMKMMEHFLQSYMNRVFSVMKEGGIKEPMLHAKSYIGMLDRLKMDILFNHEFTRENLEKDIHFVSHLFIHGCAIPE
ncbi:TetR/AcrR family fatty acid metabolism transcriptional regulator [Paenibacillus shirakamiensis]|uniref:TetR/AcrR family fatty acid metabolism transcriptional regulator n=1 Tax=Paenibacillus shirakamiensis TaxID=1265935 RepID=A0ABS4JHZ3_9BACL|nr:TetR/AcrR family transcriptional regulator [Paenibacillus shirakamiensis]MBP2001317.1 TetR/AcrR family fatty acid metabolism transcriptional regulator [Paenibacillus shirakamiensis]